MAGTPLVIRGPMVVDGPDAEPITIEECRSHLEAALYDDTAVDDLDDAMILAWLGAAREHCEQFTGLSLAPRVLEIALDRFPTAADDGSAAIELPFGPVVEIVSVGASAASSSSSSSTSSDADLLSPSDYLLDQYSSPNRLLPTSSWPAASGDLAVKVQYIAGYGDVTNGGSPLPAAARAAMLLVLGHLYRNREQTTEKAMADLPLGVDALLRPLRVRLGMA